jgi:hypothetical protein
MPAGKKARKRIAGWKNVKNVNGDVYNVETHLIMSQQL